MFSKLHANLHRTSTKSAEKFSRSVYEVDAPLAQSVERFHGKEKVNSSILLGGSVVFLLSQKLSNVAV